MFAMRVFLCYPMNDADARLVDAVRKTLISHHCEVCAETKSGAGSLSDHVKQAILTCQAIVSIATAQSRLKLPDGGYAIAPWIQQEIAFGVACHIPVVPMLEDRVNADDLKITGDIKYIRFSRDDLMTAILDLAQTIHDIQGPPAYVKPVQTMVHDTDYSAMYSPEIAKILEAARGCLTVKHHAEARSLWNEAIQKDPGCWTAWLNLATSLAEAGDAAEASELLKRVIESASFETTRAKALHNLAAVMELLDGDVDADRVRARLQYFLKALEIEPERVNTRYSVFLTYVALGEYDKAEKVFRESLRYPDFVSHVQRFLKEEPADVVRTIARYLDAEILEIAFPERRRRQ